MVTLTGIKNSLYGKITRINLVKLFLIRNVEKKENKKIKSTISDNKVLYLGELIELDETEMIYHI